MVSLEKMVGKFPESLLKTEHDFFMRTLSNEEISVEQHKQSLKNINEPIVTIKFEKYTPDNTTLYTREEIERILSTESICRVYGSPDCSGELLYIHINRASAYIAQNSRRGLGNNLLFMDNGVLIWYSNPKQLFDQPIHSVSRETAKRFGVDTDEPELYMINGSIENFNKYFAIVDIDLTKRSFHFWDSLAEFEITGTYEVYGL